MSSEAYLLAQSAISDLKTAVHIILSENDTGLRNVDIGKILGIYAGHEGHVGHIPRALLAMMEREGVAVQDEDKMWRLQAHPLD